MAIVYKIDVLKELKKKGYNSVVIRNEKIFAQETYKALKYQKSITLHTLDKICKLLEMQPGDIIGYEED